MNLYITNIGFGRHVFSQPVNMSYGNALYDFQAYDCHVGWNGSVVSCIAPPGASRGLRWTMTINGFQGYLSAPDVVLNYKPPVLYNIFSATNQTKTSPSNGSESFNVTGVNFGPAYLEAVWWVRYSPVEYPNLVFTAECTIIVDHLTLQCVTGVQVGNHLYWTINVADQISAVPFTSTRVPNITSVTIVEIGEWVRYFPNGTAYGAVPIWNTGLVPAPNATSGLSTTGGGVVVINGTYVFCGCLIPAM